MTTAVAQSGAGSTPATVVEVGFDDSLSPSEEAYFESGGEKLDGLDGGDDTAPETPAEAPKAPAKAKATEEAEEAPADPAAAEAPAKGKQTTVPHAALHEEREGHKATKAERQAAIERAVRAEAKLQMIAEAFQARRPDPEAEVKRGDPPPAPDPMPDPEKDIFGAFNWLVKQHTDLQGKLGEAQKQTGEQIKQTREQQEAHQNHVALKNAYDADARGFWQQNPDFNEAYNFLQQSRANELVLLGHDPQKIPEMLYREEMNLAANYLGRRQSAAEAIYKLAQHRGYTPKQAAAAAEAAAEPAAANGAAKPNGQAKKPTPADEIAAIERGQSAARTLSGTGGSAADALTPEALIAMNEDEFAKVVEKLTPAQERALFGG